MGPHPHPPRGIALTEGVVWAVLLAAHNMETVQPPKKLEFLGELRGGRTSAGMPWRWCGRGCVAGAISPGLLGGLAQTHTPRGLAQAAW